MKTEREALRVLIVEDSPDDALLVLHELERDGFDPVYERVDTPEGLRTALSDELRWDLIISDYSMPRFRAPEALKIVRASDLDAPFIIVSGTLGEEAAVEAMKAGAQDYVMKDRLSRLGSTVARELREAEARRRFREAEEALRASEERFRATFEQAAVGMAHANLDGDWLKVNRKLCDISGYEEGELLGMSFQDITHPDDLDADLKQMERLYAGEIETYSVEKRYVRKDGSAVWVEVTSSLARAPSGEPEYRIAVVEDISQRKRTEEELRRQAELLDLSHEPIFAWEPGGSGIVYWNRGSEGLYGFPREEAVGQDNHRLLQTVHPVPLEQVQEALEHEGWWAGELEHTTRSGRHVVVESRQMLVETSDGRRLVLETNRNVTERRRAEEALKQSEQRLQDILDNSPAVVYVKDPEGRFVLVNRRFEELFQVSKERVLGKTDHDLFPKEAADAFRENDEEVLRSGLPLEIEETAPQDDGEHVYLSVKFPLRGPDGAPYAVCGISTDITERKRAEEDLREVREVERNRMARDLHDGALQDLTYALAAAQLVQMLPDTPERKERLQGAVDALKRAGEGLREAVYDLRQDDNPEGGFVRSVESLVELNRKMSSGWEVELVVGEGVPEELPERMGKELLRVVQEALTNARKHSGGGKVRVALTMEGDWLVAEVEDDGRGFDPSSTGAGVGTRSMRERAAALGGELEVESQPGKGTTVRVRTPKSDD